MLIILLFFVISLQMMPFSDLLSDLTNQTREAHDMPSLKVDDALSKAAQTQASLMCRNRALIHTQTLSDRLLHLNYFGSVGENIARSKTQNVMNVWMKSDVHRKNLLANWEDIGTGQCVDDDGWWYVVVIFGKRRKENTEKKEENNLKNKLSYMIKKSDTAEKQPNKSIPANDTSKNEKVVSNKDETKKQDNQATRKFKLILDLEKFQNLFQSRKSETNKDENKSELKEKETDKKSENINKMNPSKDSIKKDTPNPQNPIPFSSYIQNIFNKLDKSNDKINEARILPVQTLIEKIGNSTEEKSSKKNNEDNINSILDELTVLLNRNISPIRDSFEMKFQNFNEQLDMFKKQMMTLAGWIKQHILLDHKSEKQEHKNEQKDDNKEIPNSNINNVNLSSFLTEITDRVNNVLDANNQSISDLVDSKNNQLFREVVKKLDETTDLKCESQERRGIKEESKKQTTKKESNNKTTKQSNEKPDEINTVGKEFSKQTNEKVDEIKQIVRNAVKELLTKENDKDRDLNKKNIEVKKSEKENVKKKESTEEKEPSKEKGLEKKIFKNEEPTEEKILKKKEPSEEKELGKEKIAQNEEPDKVNAEDTQKDINKDNQKLDNNSVDIIHQNKAFLVPVFIKEPKQDTKKSKEIKSPRKAKKSYRNGKEKKTVKNERDEESNTEDLEEKNKESDITDILKEIEKIEKTLSSLEKKKLTHEKESSETIPIEEPVIVKDPVKIVTVKQEPIKEIKITEENTSKERSVPENISATDKETQNNSQKNNLTNVIELLENYLSVKEKEQKSDSNSDKSSNLNSPPTTTNIINILPKRSRYDPYNLNLTPSSTKISVLCHYNMIDPQSCSKNEDTKREPDYETFIPDKSIYQENLSKTLPDFNKYESVPTCNEEEGVQIGVPIFYGMSEVS